MLPAPLTPACLVLVATLVLAGSARAQVPASPGSVQNIPLPEDVEPALAAEGEHVTRDRSQILVEFIRRTYGSPLRRTHLDDEAALSSLLSRTDGGNGSGAARVGTLPLPLPPTVWIDTVFGGRETPQTLFNALLRSRGPALLYYGLLSLDDDTRAWLTTEPQLLAQLAGKRAAAFVVAAPGLRVRDGTVDVPGGAAAGHAWEALVGHTTADPAGFTRALLARDDGHLASFFATVAQLTPAQQRVALRLDSPDPATRLDAARRLRAVQGRVVRGWRIDKSPFWRPPVDPARLVASLRRDHHGRPVVPGTRQFWTSVFDAPGRPVPESGAEAGRPASGDAETVDFAWMCEQIFKGHSLDDRRRYDLVLLVSRLEARQAKWSGPEAVLATRAALTYPALIFSLERAKLVDVAAFAAAAQRADRIADIRDRARAERAHKQFQGALALVTRVASRGGMRPQALATVISSLSSIELSDRGDYEGRVVGWLAGWLAAHVHDAPPPPLEVATAGPIERDALAALAGPADARPRFVDWEGTRYRLDFASAESTRIGRLLGEQPRPFLSSAHALVGMAEAIDREGLTPDGARRHAGTLEGIATAVRWDPADGWEQSDCPRRYRAARTALRRAAGPGGIGSARQLAATLRTLADDLLARGLMELAYAVALGQPERTLITADEAARRHDFGSKMSLGRSLGWILPTAGTVLQRGWRVTGSVLALDLRLADLALQRVSSRPPLRKPTLPSDQRRVLVETVAMIEAASLEDADAARIVSAIRKGRSRLAAARTADDAGALAEEIRLSPSRRTLLSWAVTADRRSLPAFLSASELLWLGLERAPVAAGLHAWGAPASPRTGCLCLEMLDRQAWETLSGRPHAGALASAFPDLNLRLAELLDELQMPAALLAPVLAAATIDLVDNAAVRDVDDRQGLQDFVRSLRRERVEEYLALLTTDGPLVPVEPGSAR